MRVHDPQQSDRPDHVHLTHAQAVARELRLVPAGRAIWQGRCPCCGAAVGFVMRSDHALLTAECRNCGSPEVARALVHADRRVRRARRRQREAAR